MGTRIIAVCSEMNKSVLRTSPLPSRMSAIDDGDVFGTAEIDLAKVLEAKREYPRYVNDLPAE